jgi:hypothetical protein
MINPLDIARSWIKAIKHTQEEEERALKRMAVCSECPNKNSMNVCTDCGCPLVAKQYSFFPCDKWEE